MQSWLIRLANLWMHHVHPRLSSFVAFFGGLWLGACVLTLYLLAELTDEVLEREAIAFDTTVLLHIHQWTNPTLDALMLGITRIGDPRFVVPLTAGVFLLLWWRHRLESIFFALDAFGGVVLSYVLKWVFSKPRPDLWPQLIEETTFSYPSGHALGSMVLYGYLSYVVATLYPRYRRWAYAIATLLITAIGFSRLYLGVHWPTDILAGYGIGFLWVTVCIALLRLERAKGAA